MLTRGAGGPRFPGQSIPLAGPTGYARARADGERDQRHANDWQWLQIELPPERGDYFIGFDAFLKERLKVEPGEKLNALSDQLDLATPRAWTTTQYPDPAYLDRIPPDVYSGQPPVYRRAGHGYLLYSVGPNGLDDDPRGDDLPVRMPLPPPRPKE